MISISFYYSLWLKFMIWYNTRNSHERSRDFSFLTPEILCKWSLNLPKTTIEFNIWIWDSAQKRMSYIISLRFLTDINHLTMCYHCVLLERVIVVTTWYQINAAMQGTLDVMGRILPTTPCSSATRKPNTDVKTTQMRPQRLITFSSPSRHGNDNWITLIRCLRFWSRRLKCIVEVLIL